MTSRFTSFFNHILIARLPISKFGIYLIVFILLFFAGWGVNAQCDGLTTGSNRGDFFISGGECNITGNVSLSNQGGANDLTVQSGGILVIDGNFTNNGQGTVTVQSGGLLYVTGSFSSGSNASIVFLGDVVIDQSFTNSGNANISSSGSVTIGGNFTNSANGNSTFTVDGPLNVTGDLVASGNNTLVINDGGIVKAETITYEGSITVNQGGTVYAPNGVTSTAGIDPTTNPDADCTNNCCGALCNTGGDALNDSGNQALPVSLLTFKASIESNKVILTWRTLSETNNEYFTLEKSHDGINFYELARVDGAGTTNELQTYGYEDYHSDKQAFYRLSQTDFDGTHEVLDAIRVGAGSAFIDPSCYPNPMYQTRELTVDNVSADMTWQVFDVSGALIYSGNFLIDNKVSLSELHSGTYMIRLSGSQQSFAERIILK